MSCQVAPSAASNLVMLSKVRRNWARKIADVNGAPRFVDAGGAGNQQDAEAIQIDAHAAGEGAAVVIGFVESCVIGDGPLHDRALWPLPRVVLEHS